MHGKSGLPAYTLAALVGLAFGAGDQYLGTIHVSQHFAASTTVSGMSAPWLLLPFAAGATQRSARRSALAGLMISLFAVVGYTAMILSPAEGAHSARALLATPLSQGVWFVAALFSGPFYGVLGSRWRMLRSQLSALLAAVPLLFEPIAGFLRLARWSSGDLAGYELELAAAVGVACYFVGAIWRNSQRTRSASTT